MVVWKTVYESATKTNSGNIANGSSELLGATTTDKIAFATHNTNFNRAIFRNNDTNDVVIRFDGDLITSRAFDLPQKSSLVITPEEDFHFSDMAIRNDSGAQVDAGLVTINCAIVLKESD